MSYQLWELLLRIRKIKSNEALTCSECFAVIDLLVEGVELGVELSQLEKMANRHLASCSHCQQQLDDRLRRLEAMLGNSADPRPGQQHTGAGQA